MKIKKENKVNGGHNWQSLVSVLVQDFKCFPYWIIIWRGYEGLRMLSTHYYYYEALSHLSFNSYEGTKEKDASLEQSRGVALLEMMIIFVSWTWNFTLIMKLIVLTMVRDKWCNGVFCSTRNLFSEFWCNLDKKERWEVDEKARVTKYCNLKATTRTWP